jgi:MFS family permease
LPVRGKVFVNNPFTIFKNKVIGRFPAGIWVITLVGALNSAAYSMGLPFLALYLSEKRGVSTSLIGVIMLIGLAVPAVPQLLAGTVSDRIGRRPLLIITGVLSVLLFVALALSIGYSAPVWVIALLYTATRAVVVMQRPGIMAMAIDLAPKERLPEVYSLFRVGGNLGWAAGPAAGGFLAASLSYAWLFGVSTVITIAALICIFFFLKESFSQRTERVPLSSIISAAKDRNLLVITVLSAMVFLVLAQLGSTLSIYSVQVAGFTKPQYGFLLTTNGLLVAIFQYPISRLLGRFGNTFSLAAGAFLFGAGYLIMSWVGGYGLALGAIAIVTAGEILFSPTSMAVVGKLASSAWRGRYMAFFGAAETLGMASGLFLGGYLLDVFPHHPLGVWGIISLSAFAAAIGFVVFRIERRIKK